MYSMRLVYPLIISLFGNSRREMKYNTLSRKNTFRFHFNVPTFFEYFKLKGSSYIKQWHNNMVTGLGKFQEPTARGGPEGPYLWQLTIRSRPKTIDDIVDQGEVVQVLRECLAGGDLPHLLFYGPPGTGKTSAILAASRQLFGDMVKDRVLELNASDERGIQVIRDKVKTFSQLTVSSTRPEFVVLGHMISSPSWSFPIAEDQDQHALNYQLYACTAICPLHYEKLLAGFNILDSDYTGRPCPPFKLVILDEADSMTHAAQAALRRTIERETRSTRFCLICNYVSRIIPPITSRCSKFRFKPLARENIIKRLEEICTAEGVDSGDGETLAMAVDACGGDLRKALTALQCCQRLTGAVTHAAVVEVTGLVPDELVTKYLSINSYAELEKFVESFLLEAYSAAQLLVQLSTMLVNSEYLTNKQKCLVSEKLAICSHRLLDGGSEMMQLTDLGCTLIMANNAH